MEKLEWEKMLRDAIQESGLSHYRINKETGVDVTLIGRFMRGERGLTLPTAERIANVVGLELKRKEK